MSAMIIVVMGVAERVATGTAMIRFWSEDNHSRFDVLSWDGELHVQHGTPPEDSAPLPLSNLQPESKPMPGRKEGAA